MTDLFLTNQEYLLARWDYLQTVFRIVARDSQRREDLPPKTPPEAPERRNPFDSHRCVLRQTVSDLIELEADLTRMGKDSPANALHGRWRQMWETAAAWVREERVWRFPHEKISDEELRQVNDRRAEAERRFLAVVDAHWPRPVSADPPADETPAADDPVPVQDKHAPLVTAPVFHTTTNPLARRV